MDRSRLAQIIHDELHRRLDEHLDTGRNTFVPFAETAPEHQELYREVADEAASALGVRLDG